MNEDSSKRIKNSKGDTTSERFAAKTSATERVNVHRKFVFLQRRAEFYGFFMCEAVAIDLLGAYRAVFLYGSRMCVNAHN